MTKILQLAYWITAISLVMSAMAVSVSKSDKVKLISAVIMVSSFVVGILAIFILAILQLYA